MIVAGSLALSRLPHRRRPQDITNVQVQILTKSPPSTRRDRAVHHLPGEAAMNGLPDLVEDPLDLALTAFRRDRWVRGCRNMGTSARQLVSERLIQAREATGRLRDAGDGSCLDRLGEGPTCSRPRETASRDGSGARSRLGNRAASARGPRRDRGQRLGRVCPSSTQSSWDPSSLVAYSLSLGDVFEAVEHGSGNAGGGYRTEPRANTFIRAGEGMVHSLDESEDGREERRARVSR